MENRRWTAILSRITRDDVADLDDIAGAHDPRRAPAGSAVFPEIDAVLMPAVALRRADAVTVGIAAPEPLADAADRALRLAAFAIERDVEVVALAGSDTSGLERFGIRTERVAGATPASRAAAEDQIRRFWSIDLVL